MAGATTRATATSNVGMRPLTDQVGDVLMWDNRATLRRRDEFNPAHRRLMDRTQIKCAAAPVAA